MPPAHVAAQLPVLGGGGAEEGGLFVQQMG